MGGSVILRRSMHDRFTQERSNVVLDEPVKHCRVGLARGSRTLPSNAFCDAVGAT